MDYGRSCHTSLMDFAGDGSMIRKVRWYWAPKGALPFPGWHRFGNTSWMEVPRSNAGLGEQWNSDFKYDKGTPPAGVSGQGEPCGPLDWYTLGVPANAPPLRVSPSMVPDCCGTASGVLVGGYSTGYRGSSVPAGIRAGATSLTAIRLVSYAGLKAGSIEPNITRLRVSTGGNYLRSWSFPSRGFVGLKVGLKATLKVPYPGSLGVKVGPLEAHHVPATGSLGVEVGPSSSTHTIGPVVVAGHIGIKVGPAGTIFTGYQNQCCPGATIPATLYGSCDGVSGIQFVYSSGVGGWQWYNILDGYTFLLNCVQETPGVWKWHFRSTPSTHCTITQTLHSLVCAPTFSIDIEVNQTGALCMSAGDFRAVLHG